MRFTVSTVWRARHHAIGQDPDLPRTAAVSGPTILDTTSDLIDLALVYQRQFGGGGNVCFTVGRTRYHAIGQILNLPPCVSIPLGIRQLPTLLPVIGAIHIPALERAIRRTGQDARNICAQASNQVAGVALNDHALPYPRPRQPLQQLAVALVMMGFGAGDHPCRPSRGEQRRALGIVSQC